MAIKPKSVNTWRRVPERSARKAQPIRSRGSLGDEVAQALQPPAAKHMTEEEFSQWVGEKTRAEWIDGEVVSISPVNLEHDRIQGWLYRLFSEFVEVEECGQVCGSEFMVRLAGDGGSTRRRLTDLFFIGNGHLSRLKKTYFDGAPDLIVEVVSLDSTSRDYREKFEDYQAAGVREYWIVDPLSKTVTAFELSKGAYRAIGAKSGMIRSKVLKGLFINPEWLWSMPFPKLAQVVREMGLR